MPIRQQLASSFTERYRQPSFWLHVLLFGLLTAALWPLTTWFAQTANDQSRIFNALIVLVAASVLLVRFGGVTVTQPFELNASARRALYAAYGLLMATYLVPMVVDAAWARLLIIPAYCCALAAMVRFVFGEGTATTHTNRGRHAVCILITEHLNGTTGLALTLDGRPVERLCARAIRAKHRSRAGRARGGSTDANLKGQ